MLKLWRCHGIDSNLIALTCLKLTPVVRVPLIPIPIAVHIVHSLVQCNLIIMCLLVFCTDVSISNSLANHCLHGTIEEFTQVAFFPAKSDEWSTFPCFVLI